MDYVDIMERQMILNNDFLTEDEYYDRLRLETLDDKKFNAASTISESVLGFTALALLGGFGGALIAKSVGNKKGKVKGFFKRIFGKKKEFDFDANKNRAVVKREQDKIKIAEEKIPEVIKAIKMEDWDEAERLFDASKYTDNIDVIKAVIMAISEVIGEPPLFVYPSGNDTYFKCKKVVGMKYAKAAAQAVVVAMKQQKPLSDIELNV